MGRRHFEQRITIAHRRPGEHADTLDKHCSRRRKEKKTAEEGYVVSVWRLRGSPPSLAQNLSRMRRPSGIEFFYIDPAAK